MSTHHYQPHDPLAVLLADLAAAGQATQWMLGPLTHSEAGLLLDKLRADRADAAMVRERRLHRAVGVPFFLISSMQGLPLPAGERAGARLDSRSNASTRSAMVRSTLLTRET